MVLLRYEQQRRKKNTFNEHHILNIFMHFYASSWQPAVQKPRRTSQSAISRSDIIHIDLKLKINRKTLHRHNEDRKREEGKKKSAKYIKNETRNGDADPVGRYKIQRNLSVGHNYPAGRLTRRSTITRFVVYNLIDFEPRSFVVEYDVMTQ
jgi:hypothetical protein